ncbi:MAG TPA: DUF6766 family protein [Acidimicrobiia bacterium]
MASALLRPSARRRAAGRTRSTRRGGDGYWQRNALGLVCFATFVVLMVGLLLSGHGAYNAEQRELEQPTISLLSYLGEGHFWEAVFENWESEFLQMAAYVVLTAYLIQKGSSESKDPDRDEPVEADPRDVDRRRSDVPWPVTRGGVWLWVYENSLVLAFVALFLASIAGHAFGGLDAYNDQLRQNGEAAVSVWGYVSGAEFWYESLQNWQSEFLAVFAIIVLSIYLRQRGSPESKPVVEPHSSTGTA